MSTDAEVIKSFLVSLGYQMDESSHRRFTTSIEDATKDALKLGAAVTAAATAVVAGVSKIADSFEQLYFSSQRNKASVEMIQSLDFAARQLGGSAQGAVEALGQFMRTTPGAVAFLERLGVQTHDANGQLKDTGQLLLDLGQRLKGMPYYRAKAYADFLGIDEKTLIALEQGLGQFSDQYRSMLRAAHLDSDAAAKSSHAFMVELRTLGAAFSILGKKAASELTDRLGGDIRQLRNFIVAHFDDISAAIVKVSELLLKLADIVVTALVRTGQVVKNVFDWFGRLDTETQHLIEGIGLLGVAWATLNSAFALSPIGRVLALVGAIALLIDDFQVWKSGGKSLINWGAWSSEIDKITGAVDRLGKALAKLAPLFGHLGGDAAKSQAGEANVLIDFLTGNWNKKIAPSSIANGGIYSLLGNVSDAIDPATRGIRNNNPGNLNFVGQPGATREDGPGRFAKFATAQDGLNALADQLRRYGTRGLHTIRQIINTFSPAGENGTANTNAYINDMVQRMGIDPDTVIDQNRDPAALAALMRGIIAHENSGKNPYSAGQINQAVGLGPAPGAPVQVSQKTDIHIHGVSDPQQAGQAVASQQSQVNEQMVRGLRGAVQ